VLETVQDYIDAKLTHSIHTSGSKSFRGCRRRWNWLFNEFWYPKTTAKPLEFGVAYHVGMEALYDPKLWDKPESVVLALAQKAFYDTCHKQWKAYEEAFGADDEVRKDYEERVQLGQGMLKYHVEHVRRKDKIAGYKPLFVEVPFEVPLTDENGEQIWCKCKTCWTRFKNWLRENTEQASFYNQRGQEVFIDLIPSPSEHGDIQWEGWRGLPVTYGGRIDVILEGPDGRVWVLDWKTAARLAEDTATFLLVDDQITRYLAALRECGYRVAGFIYHEQKKALPDEPEPMERRYKGKLFSTNKQQDVEFDTYLKTVKENDPEAYMEGLYDEYLNFLRDNPNRFYGRHVIHRNDIELDMAWENVLLEAKDMIDPNLRIYPNAGRFNCQTCAFLQPCLGKSNGEDYEYTLRTLFDKRKYHYFEDAKPSTEHQGRSA
jgi:hypothetical protein